jgi:hypothetical protein
MFSLPEIIPLLISYHVPDGTCPRVRLLSPDDPDVLRPAAILVSVDSAFTEKETGHVWIRPTEEFLDGRFERVLSSQPEAER